MSEQPPPKFEFCLFVINKYPEYPQEFNNELRIRGEAPHDNTAYRSSSSSRIINSSSSDDDEDSCNENVFKNTNNQTDYLNALSSDKSTEAEDNCSDFEDELKLTKRNKTFITYPSKTNRYKCDDIQKKINKNKQNRNIRSTFKRNNKNETVKIFDLNINQTTRRYPKRSTKVVNYYEGEPNDCDDDCYIFCDICEEEFYDGCEIHPLQTIFDNVIPFKPRNKYRARYTTPYKYVKIERSTIPEAGEGIFSSVRLPIGLRFGPYEGTAEDTDNGGYYSWQIKKNGKMVSMVDGYDESISNWMRFVNCARNVEEQNVMAFVYRGNIFYRTVKNIPKDTEVLVYYGDNYAKELKINTKNFHYLARSNK